MKKLCLGVILVILVSGLLAFGASGQTDASGLGGLETAAKAIFTYGPAAIIAIFILVLEPRIRKTWKAASTDRDRKVFVILYCLNWVAIISFAAAFVPIWYRIVCPREYTIRGTFENFRDPQNVFVEGTTDYTWYLCPIYSRGTPAALTDGRFSYDWRIVSGKPLVNRDLYFVFHRGDLNDQDHKLRIDEDFYKGKVRIRYNRETDKLRLESIGDKQVGTEVTIAKRVTPREPGKRRWWSAETAYAQEKEVSSRESLIMRLQSHNPIIYRDARKELVDRGSDALPLIQDILADRDAPYELRLSLISSLNQMEKLVIDQFGEPTLRAIVDAIRNPDPNLRSEARRFILRYRDELTDRLDVMAGQARELGEYDHVSELSHIELDVLYEIGMGYMERYKSGKPENREVIEESIRSFAKAWEIRSLASEDQIAFTKALYGWGYALHELSKTELLPTGERDPELIREAKGKFWEFVDVVQGSESGVAAYPYPDHLSRALAYTEKPTSESLQGALIAPGDLPEEIVTLKDGATMVLIPAGPFIYGMSSGDMESVYRYDGARPPTFKYELTAAEERIPRLSAYYIDKCEVTNGQYAKFLRETGHRIPGHWNDPEFNHPDQPVVGVGPNDAKAYCEWVGKRLPTEKEWEKAARGMDGRWWPWGNEFIRDYCNSDELRKGVTVPVGTLPKGRSPYGVLDMAGNVWEIVERGSDLYPWAGLVMRGGGFSSRNTFVRTTARWSPRDDQNGAEWLGFRGVKDIE